METLKNNLIYVLNHSGVDIDAAYYVMKDVFRDLEEQYNIYLIKQERQKIAQEQEQSEEAEDKEETVEE